MFAERTFQVQANHEDIHHVPKDDLFKPRRKKIQHFLNNKGKAYLKLFLDTSSIHGLNHLVATRRQFMEISIWLIIIVLSAIGSLYLSSLTWRRYQSSPTVVSMDRDMFAWNTTFPCVTICPNGVKNIDRKKLEAYVSNSGVENKTLLETFIIGLANASFKSFEYVPQYPDIPSEDYMDLLMNLSLPFKPTLTIGVTNVALVTVPTITEMGLCHAVNSKVAVYNSPDYIIKNDPIYRLVHNMYTNKEMDDVFVKNITKELVFSETIAIRVTKEKMLRQMVAKFKSYRDANRWDMVTNGIKPLNIHPLDGEVFAQVMNMTTSYNVYLHGPEEIPDITAKSSLSDQGYYMKLYVTAISIYTSTEAAKLSVSQRRCRFTHENNLKHNSIYTYNMCRMECRIRLCLKYCQCVPHFYRTIGNERICGAKDMQCLSKHKDELYTLEDKNKKRIDCGCFPLCDDVNYIIQSNALQEWFLGTNFQWGMVSYPRLRYRRDIIFGFTDVLVAVGGMAGLFLGCSVLSFIEIVYFLTLRLLCYRYKQQSSK